MERQCKITYVSNAGILLDDNSHKIMIDGFCDSILPIYKNPPDEIRECMISGAEPFDNVEILLFTHNHTDHFDARSTVRFLKHNSEALVMGPREVITEIRQAYPYIGNSRLISLNGGNRTPECISLKGMDIQAIPMLHDGKEYRDVNNLAYLVDIGGKTVLHAGDAKAADENYIHLDLMRKNIDLFIAPFPYVSLPKARQVIEKYILPRKIAIVHFPHKELDSYGWIDATMKGYMRIKDDFTETVFFENAGEYLYI